MFKFYQRPLDDAAMTGEIKVFGDFNKDYAQESNTSTKVENTALTYYDHILLKIVLGTMFITARRHLATFMYGWLHKHKQLRHILTTKKEVVLQL